MYRPVAAWLSLAFDLFNGRRVYRCRKFLERTQWMKRRDLQQLQLRRLRALLRHAYNNVPYYHELYRGVKFHPSDFTSLDDLWRLPVLKRSTLRDQSERFRAVNIPKRETAIWATSGTTAAPIGLYRSKLDISWGVAAELRGYGWAGYELGDKVGQLWLLHSTQRGSLWFTIKNLLLRNIVLDVGFISEKSMESFARKMHIFKPHFLRGYASSMSVFAAFMLQSEAIRISPRAIFTSGTNLFPHYRKIIEEAFNCEVYDYYSSAEMSHIAAQCGRHEGLHVSEENVLVEVVDDGEAASPGESGRILVTNLHNYAMPLIRYDIGDTGKFYADTCECGRKLSLLKPTGRTYEYFISDDGSLTTLRDFQTVFEDMPIKDFQVVQESHNSIVIKIMPLSGFTEADATFIVDHIMSHGSARIRVELVDSISMERSGKIRHLVSKISNKYSRVL